MKTKSKFSLIVLCIAVMLFVSAIFTMNVKTSSANEGQTVEYSLVNEKLLTAQRGASYSKFDGVRVQGYKIVPSGYVTNSYINEFLGVTLNFASVDLSKYNAIMFRYVNGNNNSSLRLSINQSGKGNINMDLYQEVNDVITKNTTTNANLKTINKFFDGNLICVPANGTASYTSVTSLCLYYNQLQANWSYFTVGDVYFVNYDATANKITAKSDVVWSVNFENANYQKQFTQYITKYSYNDADSAGIVRAMRANELYVNSATYYLYDADEDDFVPTTAQTNTLEWYYGDSMNEISVEGAYDVEDLIFCLDIKNLGTITPAMVIQVGTNTLQRYDFTLSEAPFVLVAKDGTQSYATGIPVGFEGKAYLPVKLMQKTMSTVNYGSFASVKMVVTSANSVGADYLIKNVSFVTAIDLANTPNVSCGENGKVEVTNEYGVIVNGAPATYVVTANENYIIDTVKYGGEEVTLTAENTYYVDAYDSAKAFEVAFKNITYTVTFNGASGIQSQTVNANGVASKPTDPVKDNYQFLGWFTDAECTIAYDFNTKVTSNKTLYAGWKKIDASNNEMPAQKKESSCSSNIASTSVIIATVSLLACCVVMLKKAKNK